jgi:hypothetical protein
MKSGAAARRSIPSLIAAWPTNCLVRDRRRAVPIARARHLALGGGDRNPPQDHGDRQSEQDADDGKRESADKEPQNNPSYQIPGYCWGCAEVAGGLVSRMTGKSSGSFAAQAATSSVEAKQSAAVVPASAARMLPDWWSMSRLHISCGGASVDSAPPHLLWGSIARELQTKALRGQEGGGEIR